MPVHHRHVITLSSSSSDLPLSTTQGSQPGYVSPDPGHPSNNGVPGSVKQAPPGLLQRVKEYFVGSKLEKDKLAQLGMGAFASYGVISNVTYGICVCIAWISFMKSSGTTPLAPGQWKPFLAFYAGLWTIQNFIRPARFALAVALAPTFDRLIQWIGRRTGLPKPAAFGILVFSIGVCTLTTLVSALYLLGGFPDGIPFLTQRAAA